MFYTSDEWSAIQQSTTELTDEQLALTITPGDAGHINDHILIKKMLLYSALERSYRVGKSGPDAFNIEDRGVESTVSLGGGRAYRDMIINGPYFAVGSRAELQTLPPEEWNDGDWMVGYSIGQRASLEQILYEIRSQILDLTSRLGALENPA